MHTMYPIYTKSRSIICHSVIRAALESRPLLFYSNKVFSKSEFNMALVSPANINNEYKKQSEIKPENIKLLREWIKTQPYLPYEYITDLDIVLAHHSCEYDMERTKAVLDLNYTLRSLFTLYQNREIDKSLERAFESWLVTPLATPTNKGYRSIYCQLLNPDANKFVYSDVVRAFVMIVDLYLYEEGTLPGVAIIINMDKVSLDHMSRIDLVVAQQFFYFLQEAMFVRLREFHFINAPSFIDRLLSMFKPFMKNDFLSMLHVHVAGSDSLNDFMPIVALPKDAGGENLNSSELKDHIWNKIKANENFFKQESKKIVNESKRPGDSKTMSTFFPSLEKSFKQLEID